MHRLAVGCRTSIVSFDYAFTPAYQQIPAEKGDSRKSNPYSRFFSRIKSMASSDSFPPANLKEIANEVATLLKEKKETIAVAETVGLLDYVHRKN